MAASRAVSSQRLCSKYRRWFFIASCMLAIQLFLAFSFYNTSQKESERERRTKYEPSLEESVGSRALVDSSDGVDKVDEGGFNVRNVKHLSDTNHHVVNTERKNKGILYKPVCNITGPEALSALSRAKTNQCKQEIADLVCKAQAGTLYPKSLPRFCPLKGNDTMEYKGCYQDNFQSRDMVGHHVDFPLDNSPQKCSLFCLQAGFRYAGVQYGRECWCADTYGNHGSLPEGKCDSICPHDILEKCGGHLSMRVYSTGLGRKAKHISHFMKGGAGHPVEGVRIVYVLTVTGRALRQVIRLFKAIFHVNHYFFIHVDKRQDYLHRELTKLLSGYSNVKFCQTRFATIWGGASLLTMLLQCMKEILDIKEWNWDYFINLSESDFPIQKDNDLVAFLTEFKGYNFLRSHGRDTPRFIKKQGLDKTFYQCENRMWKIGSRVLPTGIRIDGGSDWVGLYRDFCKYITMSRDELVTQLKHLYGLALLPAESFFHTLSQNSIFCDKVINNNLHLTNWMRKQGCKCQYRHIVDWCGCSPNDFKPEDFDRILSMREKPIFFARKFEAIVNQEIINDVDAYLYGAYATDTPGLTSYWQNEYHHLDDLTIAKDSHLSFYQAFMRLTLSELTTGVGQCQFAPVKLLEVSVFNEANHFHGLLVLFTVEFLSTGAVYTLESHLHPVHVYKVLNPSGPIGRLKSLQVGENFDPKERIFRNYGGLLGPYSDLVLKHSWGEGEASTLSVAWVDPAMIVAASYDIDVIAAANTGSQKPDLQKPLRPGVWTVKVMHKWSVMAETSFLVLPLTIYHERSIDAIEALMSHNGPAGFYAGRDFSDFSHVLHLQDLESSKLKANDNARKAGKDLETWVDSLTGEFWRIQGTCSKEGVVDTCPYMDQCKSTSWSSLSPDPKSELVRINKNLGRIR